ncbi:MAG: hypothetical protein IPM79_24505 [Polyangiaceae bacterium]|nr:hypothetical protein [Polyangiaceae bacterium]
MSRWTIPRLWTRDTIVASAVTSSTDSRTRKLRRFISSDTVGPSTHSMAKKRVPPSVEPWATYLTIPGSSSDARKAHSRENRSPSPGASPCSSFTATSWPVDWSIAR